MRIALAPFRWAHAVTYVPAPLQQKIAERMAVIHYAHNAVVIFPHGNENLRRDIAFPLQPRVKVRPFFV